MKAIDKYLIVCFLFVFCSLLEYAIVLLLDRGKRNFEKQKKETRNLVEKVIKVYVCAVQPTFRKYRLCSSADRLNLAPRIASLISRRTELRSRLFSRLYPNKSQGWPGFLGIQYIWVFNFRYTAFLFLKLGIKYSLTTNFGYKVYRVFLKFGILHEF